MAMALPTTRQQRQIGSKSCAEAFEGERAPADGGAVLCVYLAGLFQPPCWRPRVSATETRGYIELRMGIGRGARIFLSLCRDILSLRFGLTDDVYELPLFLFLFFVLFLVFLFSTPNIPHSLFPHISYSLLHSLSLCLESLLPRV